MTVLIITLAGLYLSGIAAGQVVRSLIREAHTAPSGREIPGVGFVEDETEKGESKIKNPCKSAFIRVQKERTNR